MSHYALCMNDNQPTYLPTYLPQVLVSDGVAAVLTGVVTSIESGQARIHYKGGRKAKLDEWIDVRSERFLSAAEVFRSCTVYQHAELSNVADKV